MLCQSSKPTSGCRWWHRTRASAAASARSHRRSGPRPTSSAAIRACSTCHANAGSRRGCAGRASPCVRKRSGRELARATGVTAERIQVWPVPIDLASFTPVDDARWQAGLDRPAIVFVGRGNDPRKNAALLIEAFALVRRRIPTARLRLVGEPPPSDVVVRGGEGVELVGEVESVADELRDAAL